MTSEAAPERYVGKWVARRFVTNEIVLAADSPAELDSKIRDRAFTDVAVMRIPTEDEPLFVGPG
jgi:hypothetical protein